MICPSNIIKPVADRALRIWAYWSGVHPCAESAAYICPDGAGRVASIAAASWVSMVCSLELNVNKITGGRCAGNNGFIIKPFINGGGDFVFCHAFDVYVGVVLVDNLGGR